MYASISSAGVSSASSDDLEYRKKVFKECYRIINNFIYMGENYCLCEHYLGLQTQMDFMLRTKTRNICCICSFPSYFNVEMLKHNRRQLRAFYDKLLKICVEALRLGCCNFWDRDIYYSVSNFQDDRVIFCNVSDDNDFLFSL